MEGAEERAHQRRTLQLIHQVAVEIELAQFSGGACVRVFIRCILDCVDVDIQSHHLTELVLQKEGICIVIHYKA
jgi:hypothetical protein